MKLAWICYLSGGGTVIKFSEPSYYLYDRVVTIVYAEIDQH